MKRSLFALSLAVVAATVTAEGTAYGKLFIGTIDVGSEHEDTQYGFEYQFASGVSRFDFKPFVGFLRTRYESHYAYTGLSRTSKFTDKPTGLAVNISLGAGYYTHGDKGDTDLGYPLELRSSGGLLWLFADGTRIGIHYAHLSNANISDVNPGTELLTITYELPF